MLCLLKIRDLMHLFPMWSAALRWDVERFAVDIEGDDADQEAPTWEKTYQGQKQQGCGDVANAPPATPTWLSPVSHWRTFTDDWERNTSPSLWLNFYWQNQVTSLCDFNRMWLELVMPSKAHWTVSTWVQLCTSVNMTLQFIFWLPTVRTTMVMCCGVQDVYASSSSQIDWNVSDTVNTCMVCVLCGLWWVWNSKQSHETPCHTFDICMVCLLCVCDLYVCLQANWPHETYVTQWTLIWFVSCVHSHVTV